MSFAGLGLTEILKKRLFIRELQTHIDQIAVPPDRIAPQPTTALPSKGRLMRYVSRHDG